MKNFLDLARNIYIFIAGKPDTKYRRFQWRMDDSYAVRFIGVDIHPNGRYYPIYVPMFSVYRKPGSLHVDIFFWSTSCLRLGI